MEKNKTTLRETAVGNGVRSGLKRAACCALAAAVICTATIGTMTATTQKAEAATSSLVSAKVSVTYNQTEARKMLKLIFIRLRS